MLDFLYYWSLVGIALLSAAFGLLCVVILKTSRPYPNVKRFKEEQSFFDPKTRRVLPLPSINDPWTVHLSVIIPAYDEEKRLRRMLDECLAFLESRGDDFIYEVIVVSDGSRDHTVEKGYVFANEYGPRKMRVLKLIKNRGKGGAVRLGVENARGAAILFADADGATKFEDLVKLEASLKELVDLDYTKRPAAASETLAIVCGSRAHLEDAAISTRSYFRTLLMHGFHFLVWLLAVRKIRDTQCGFKLFTRQAARQCFPSLHVERWAFDVELLYIAQSLNIPISEVAVNWKEIEGSKIVPVISWLEMGKDLFLIWLRYRIGAWKIMANKED